MRCCEDCVHFRRREDGLPLCLAPDFVRAHFGDRDRALHATNTVNRCRRFCMRIEDQTQGQPSVP